MVAAYTIRDGGGLTASANVVLTITPPLNRPPDARDDSADVVSGGSVTTAVLANDTDPDGDPLAVSIVGGPDASLGTASVTNDGSLFTGRVGSAGTAAVTYQVSDGELTDTAVLRINVRSCAESAPVANDGFLNTGYRQPIVVDLGAFGSGGTIVDVVGPPGYVGNVYTPPPGENGNVSISYAVVNDCGLRAAGRVTIDVNQDPSAPPKTVGAARGQELIVPVTGLASDAEVLTITGSAGAPAWVVTESSRLVIAPPLGTALGEYQWTTTVVDPGGLAATVSITLTVRNQPPVAVSDAVDVSLGAPGSFAILANDTDVDSPGGAGALVIQTISSTEIVFTNGESGTVLVGPDGRSVTIDPLDGVGTATFTYTVRDADGGVSASVSVTVTGPRGNTEPFALDQSVAVTVGEASGSTSTWATTTAIRSRWSISPIRAVW